jgi:hypothetical protein
LFIQSVSKTALLLLILSCFSFVSLNAKEVSVPFTVFKSAVVPGWGQLSMHKNRGYVYMAGEVLLISGLFYYSNEEEITQNRMYDQALHFAHIAPGNYPDSYMTTLGKFSSSGFEPGGYNYDVRIRATQLYPDNPTMQQAYIDSQMIPDDKSWNWDGPADRTVYNRYRRDVLQWQDYAKLTTGVLIANHLINIIDAARTANHQRRMHVGVNISPDWHPELSLTWNF